MRVDTSNDFGNHVVYDVDTNSILMAIKWADDESGEYCQMKHDCVDGDIKFIYNDDKNEIISEVKKANIRIIDMRLHENHKICERFNVGMHLEEVRSKALCRIPQVNN